MKKLLASILLVGTLAIAIAQTVSYNAVFTWTPNPAHEMVTGYRIEYQKLPSVTNWTYITYVPATTNSAIVKGLQGGYIYKFRAFAVNAVGTGTNQSAIVQLPSSFPSMVNSFTNQP